MMKPALLVCATAVLLAAGAVQPSQAAGSDPVAAKQVKAFLAAYEAVQTFAGRVKSETRLKGKSQTTRSKLWIAKPASTALEMIETTDMPGAAGTKLVWFGAPTVQVSTRFFGFPVKLNPNINDARLLGLRGWNMRDLSIVSAVAMLRDPRSVFRSKGADKHLGRPMHVIEARSPKLLPGIDRQVIFFDDALHLPFVMEMYDGDERAFRIEIEAFAFDTKLPQDTFRTD